MSKWKRIQHIIQAMFMILGSLILIVDTEEGYIYVLGALCIALCAYGIKMLVYYLRLAQYMVGGRMILYRSAVLINAGFFTLTLVYIPKYLSMLYLIGLLLFASVVSILRAMEAKRFKAKHWRLKFSQGIIAAIVAVSCMFFLNDSFIISITYSMGILYLAVVRIVTACRKTAIIYIQ